MNDTVTRVTSQNYFQRLGNSLVGMLIGVVLVVCGCWLLFWNDGRAVDAERGLNAGARQVVSLAAPTIDPANEDKLVHLSGPLATAAGIQDPVTGASFPTAVTLMRTVEMYQWVQNSQTTTREKVGGTQETVTTYTYTKEWSAQAQDSSTFAEPAGHENPPMPASSDRLVAADAQLGSFKLGEQALAGLSDGAPVAPAAAGEGWRVEAGTVVRGTGTAAAPQLGDLRVTYKAVASGTQMSFMGRQSGDALVPWTGRGSNYELLLSREGVVPADLMVEDQKENEQILTWVLRAVGTLMNIAGFAMLLGPLSALANVLPPLAGLVASGAGIVAMALGIPLSLLVIALAWFVFRPLLTLGLVVAAVGAFVLLSRLKSAKAQTAAA